MNQKLILLGLLTLTVLIAGCTETNGDADPAAGAEGIPSEEIIRDFSTRDPSIYGGSQTQLALTLQNPQDQHLERVEAELGNYGLLDITRQVPEGGQVGLDDTRCRYDEMSTGAGIGDREYRCIWQLSAGMDILGDARDRITLPITAFVTYQSELATDDSLSITFQRGQDIRPGDEQRSTIRGSDEEVDITVSHETPVPAESGAVPITIDLRNMGQGDIIGVDETRRSVDISFHGTLADATWDLDETTCVDRGREQTVYLEDDGDGVTLSCTIVLNEPELVDRTYSLYVEITYRYRHISETPLTVLRP